MKINKENYEVFLIDYLDGTLEEVEKSEVEQFLLMHPDIKKEFQGIENMHLSDEPLEFPLKEKIQFREDNITESDYLCIGNLEGDLTNEEQQRFEKLKQNAPEIEREIKFFSFTKLKPNLQVKFPNKSELKQKIALQRFWAYSAAASIVAAMIALVMFFGGDPVEQYSESDVKRKKVARKVEHNNGKAQDPKNKSTQKNTPSADKQGQMAANDEVFVMEFEEIELQMEENENLASINVYQPLYLSKLSHTKVPIVNSNFSDEHQLSKDLINENRQYIKYWENIYKQSFNQQ